MSSWLEFRPKTLKGIDLGGFAASDGVGWEKHVRWPSAIGPKLLFAPHEAFELVRNLTFTASTPYHSRP